MEKNDTVVRIMSANVWGNCGNAHIANRDDCMAVICEKYRPDFIGMQECSPAYRGRTHNLLLLIKDTYSEVIADTGSNTNNYTPIVYLKDKYTPMDCGFHIYTGLNDGNSKSITYAVFKNKENSKMLCHINTHFYWTSDEPGKAARLTNAAELLNTVDTLRGKYNVPIVMTGDFNCDGTSEPLRMITEGGFAEARDIALTKSPDSSGYHAYPDWDEAAGEYNGVHYPKTPHIKAIDHIFTDANASVKEHYIITDREALLSSDHCPLYIDLNI